MKHFAYFFARNGRHIFFGVVLLAVVALLAVVYRLLKSRREKKERQQLMDSFRLMVPSDAGPVELRYCHIELLSELVEPRPAEYFLPSKTDWEIRLNGDLSEAMAMFTSAQLIRKSRSVKGGAVLSVKGAALVGEHGQDADARRAAASRVRKQNSRKLYPNEKRLPETWR